MNANLRFYVHLVVGSADESSDAEVFQSLGISDILKTSANLLCEDGVCRDLYGISFRQLMIIEEAGCVGADRQCVLFEDAGAGTQITVYQNPSSESSEILGASYKPLYASKVVTSTTYIVAVNSIHRPTLEHFASKHGLTLQRLNLNGNEYKHLCVTSTNKQHCVEFGRELGIPLEDRRYFRYYSQTGTAAPRECTPSFEPKVKRKKRLHPESTSAEAP